MRHDDQENQATEATTEVEKKTSANPRASATIPEMLREHAGLVAEAKELGLDARERRSFKDRAEAIAHCDRVESQIRAHRQGAAEAEQQEESDVKKSKSKTTKKPAVKKAAAKKAAAEKPRAAGKEPRAASELGVVRAGTTRARILALADGTRTVDAVAKATGVDRKMVLAHAYCTWRDAGVGYRVDEKDKLAALYPGKKTIDDVVVEKKSK